MGCSHFDTINLVLKSKFYDFQNGHVIGENSIFLKVVSILIKLDM